MTDQERVAAVTAAVYAAGFAQRHGLPRTVERCCWLAAAVAIVVEDGDLPAWSELGALADALSEAARALREAS